MLIRLRSVSIIALSIGVQLLGVSVGGAIAATEMEHRQPSADLRVESGIVQSHSSLQPISRNGEGGDFGEGRGEPKRTQGSGTR